MAVREINSKEWTLLQPNTLPPQIDGSSCGMHGKYSRTSKMELFTKIASGF